MVRNEKQIEIVTVPFSKLYKSAKFRLELFDRVRKREIEVYVVCDNEMPVKISAVEFK